MVWRKKDEYTLNIVRNARELPWGEGNSIHNFEVKGLIGSMSVTVFGTILSIHPMRSIHILLKASSEASL
jgi:hypothetical protein